MERITVPIGLLQPQQICHSSVSQFVINGLLKRLSHIHVCYATWNDTEFYSQFPSRRCNLTQAL